MTNRINSSGTTTSASLSAVGVITGLYLVMVVVYTFSIFFARVR